MRASSLRYLRSARGQLIVACFVTSSMALVTLPGVDLAISRLFFDGRFYLREHWWPRLLHDGMVYFLTLIMATVVVVYIFNRLFKRSLCGIDGRKVAYLALVLSIGAGLIVNLGFKDQFGRARPREIVEFGGSKQFTPAFVMSDQCDKNCSFSSGEGAAGFFCVAVAMALTRRRVFHAAAMATGLTVSFARVASGAHFFSDIVVSFFVMLIVADALFFYMFMRDGARERGFAPAVRLLSPRPNTRTAGPAENSG